MARTKQEARAQQGLGVTHSNSNNSDSQSESEADRKRDASEAPPLIDPIPAHKRSRFAEPMSYFNVLAHNDNSSFKNFPDRASTPKVRQSSQEVAKQVIKKDKGKGKAKEIYMPDLPEEVWKRIFEIYYDQCADAWRTRGDLTHPLTPLLLSSFHTRVALPVLYAHPHVGFNAITPFGKSFRNPLRLLEGTRLSLVRHLTIRPTAAGRPYSQSQSPAVYSLVHPGFLDLMLLFPHLQSFTLEDTMVDNQAAARMLFQALSCTNPLKVRLEFRMWDLHDSPYSQDLSAAIKPNVYAEYSSARSQPQPPSNRSESRWVVDSSSLMHKAWRDALFTGKDLDLPAWWIELPRTDNHAQSQQNTNNHHNNTPIIPVLNNNHNHAQQNHTLHQSSNNFGVVPIHNHNQILHNTTNPSMSFDSLSIMPLNTQSQQHQQSDTLIHHSNAGHLDDQHSVHSAINWLEAMSDDDSDLKFSDDGVRSQNPSLSPLVESTVDWTDLSAQQIHSGTNVSTSVARDWFLSRSLSRSRGGLSPFINDSRSRTLGENAFDPAVPESLSLVPRQQMLPQVSCTQGDTALQAPTATGLIAFASRSDFSNDHGLSQATDTSQTDPPQEHALAAANPSVFAPLAQDEDSESLGSIRPTIDGILLPESDISASSRFPTPQNPPIRSSESPRKRKTGMRVRFEEDSGVEAETADGSEDDMLAAQRSRTDHIYIPPDIPRRSSAIMLEEAQSSRGPNDMWERDNGRASVFPNEVAVRDYGMTSYPLAHFLRGLLFDLLANKWTNTRAFSFVAFDPLASLIVRSPTLDFWPKISIEHIRVYLPRGCNSLAIFKGAKENARDRARQRIQADLELQEGNDDDDQPNPTTLGSSNIRDAETWRIVGGDGMGGDLVHENNRLFEIEVNTVAEMMDGSWQNAGAQLPPQVCRILLGEQDWQDVRLGGPSIAPEIADYHRVSLSPSTSAFDSPNFSFEDSDDEVEINDDSDHSGVQTYDAAAAAAQLKRMEERKLARTMAQP